MNEVIRMSILRQKVKTAFNLYKAGDLKGFARALVDAGDVGYQWHRDIINNEVENQLSKL